MGTESAFTHPHYMLNSGSERQVTRSLASTIGPPFTPDTLQPARTLRPRPPKCLGMEDGFVLVRKPREDEEEVESVSEARYVHDIDDFVRSLEPSLWPLNVFLHDHPELGYKEHRAHDALTSFMQSQEGWAVSRSAYGMETAWVAVYDSGQPGPAISFNAEMGIVPPVKLIILILTGTHRRPPRAGSRLWP